MENNERQVDPRLRFCLRKFGDIVHYKALSSFLSDPDVERELFAAIDNNITIDIWLIRSIAEQLLEERSRDKLPGRSLMGKIFRRTTLYLGIEIENKTEKELKNER